MTHRLQTSEERRRAQEWDTHVATLGVLLRLDAERSRALATLLDDRIREVAAEVATDHLDAEHQRGRYRRD